MHFLRTPPEVLGPLQFTSQALLLGLDCSIVLPPIKMTVILFVPLPAAARWDWGDKLWAVQVDTPAVPWITGYLSLRQ